MEVSDVRKRVYETIERARRRAAARRVRMDDAARTYETWLDQIAVPLVRQVAMVLKAESHPFTVITPGGSVRLTSDRSGSDYIELALDTTGEEPLVMGHTGRARGRRVLESEQPIGGPAIAEITEEQVLQFLMSALERLVER